MEAETIPEYGEVLSAITAINEKMEGLFTLLEDHFGPDGPVNVTYKRDGSTSEKHVSIG